MPLERSNMSVYNVMFVGVIGSQNAEGVSGQCYSLAVIPRIGEKVEIGLKVVVVVDVIHHVSLNKVQIHVK